jgi:origin recognition complex subunit 3
VEDLIQADNIDAAESLLDSDQELLSLLQTEIRESGMKLKVMTDSVRLLEVAKSQFAGSTSAQPFSSLYISALGGDLRGSALMREFLLGIKKAPSNVLTQILSCITPFIADDHQKTLNPIRLQFKSLLQKVGDSRDGLKSQYDLKNETLRTTVVAHKVELSRHKANISEEDAAYSKIIGEFHDWLAEYLEDTLIPASEIPFSEVLVYDSRGPDKAVFMPRHRYVVERALSSPHDYLNCECCRATARDDTGEAALTKTQPCTALLYQLYTESGALINAADLWSAFNGILSEDGDEDEQKNMQVCSSHSQ